MGGNSHDNNIKNLLLKFDSRKFDLESDARWKDLVQLYKKCNTEEDSRDMMLLNSPECEDVRKAIGITFFTHFASKRVRKIDQRTVENVFQFLHEKVSVQSAIRCHWTNHLKKKLDIWSGKSILPSGESISPDEVRNVIVNWSYVFKLCGLEVTTSSSTLKIFLGLAEKLLAQKYGFELCMEAMDVWTDFAWEIRAKYSEKKYRALVLQPTSISTDDVTFYMKRIYLLWTIGRGFASQNMLENVHYGTSVGQAFKLCLNPDGEFRQPPMAYQAAAEMFCHLCVPTADIPFRTENIKPLATPLTSEQFTKIAPSVTNELIQFLLNCENQSSDKLQPATIIHVLGCFFTAISKCSVECLPSLSRLTEFLAQQSSSRQSTTIIREILTRIPARLLQQRFQSDDSKEGQTSVARRLLKVILLGNGTYFEEAKKLIHVILGSDDHLAALDQVTHTLTDDAVRPGSNNVQVLKLWNMSADLFSQKISQGLEVSNDPVRSDLSSIYRFFSIPILLKNFTSDMSESTLKKFKQEWRNLYSVVKSNASLLVDFNYDDLVSSLATDLHKNGLENIGPALTLELLNLVVCNKGDTSPSFFDSQETLREADLAKHHVICTNILRAVTEHPTFKDFKSEPVESGLAIISQLLSDGQLDAFKDFSHIMPLFAKPALENRKNPSWQFSLDLVTQIFELIEKSSSAPTELFGHVEDFFILMLSDVSSRRMRYVCAQTWEAKFRQSDEKLAITDELWKLIECFYTEGKWPIPRQRDTKSKDQSEKDRSITTPLREKNSTTKSNRKNATPQRYNRQLAALSGRTPTRGTPTSRKKIMASTFQNKEDDTADFVTIDSPISFSGRRLTENQKEKIREKKGEEHVGTALYSHVDDSQSSRCMSQFLGSDTQSTSSIQVVNSTAIASDGNMPDFMEPDESAVDGTRFMLNHSAGEVTLNETVPMASSTIKETPSDQTTINMTAGAGCSAMFDETKDESVEESFQTASDSVLTPNETTINKTAGFGCQSSFNETELNGTENMTDSVDATMDETDGSVDATADLVDANGTMDMTGGVAIGTSFADCTKTVYEISDDSISFNQTNDEADVFETESMLLKVTKEKSDSKTLATDDESSLLRSTVNNKDDLSGASGKFQSVSDSANDTQEELPSQESDDVVFIEDSKDKSAVEEDTTEMDDEGSLTSGSLSPEPFRPVVDLTEETPMPKKKTLAMIDLTETHMPMPEPAVLSVSKAETDLNTSTSSLPVLSDNEEDLDEDEESIHEPFAQSFKVMNTSTGSEMARRLDFDSTTELHSTTQEFEATQEKPVETVVQSPSILKRKRSLDVSENKQRRVSFSDQFAEGSSKSVSKVFSRNRQRSSRLTLTTSSPSTRTMSRSERMLQMANGNLDGSSKQDHKITEKTSRSAVHDAIVSHQEHLSKDDRLFLIRLLSNYE